MNTATGSTPSRASGALLCLTLLLAACGGDSSSQPQPPATPTPAPTSAGPTPTAGPVAAMRLGATGTVTSVNTREWIAVYRPTPGIIGQGEIVLPPDAAPDAGPVPVVGCPWMPPIDPSCEQRG